MIMDKTILAPAQYGLLWKTSWLTSASALYSIHKKKYIDAMLLSSIFFTSLNFWRYPTISWRRTMDMSMVNIGILYQIHSAFSSKNRNGYMLLIGTGISSYYIGCQHYTKGNHWTYVYHHAGLHLFGNIASFYLYSSK